MLINEVIMLEEQDDILNAVEELLVRLKARGMTKVKTSAILAKIKAGGYSVEIDDLMNLLKNITMVGSVNAIETTFDSAVPDQVAKEKKKDKDTVSKMASSQIKKGMK